MLHIRICNLMIELWYEKAEIDFFVNALKLTTKEQLFYKTDVF